MMKNKPPKNNKKILVVGDACRDIFAYCKSDKLCPDIPVPILNVLYTTENDGMAKNLQRNIKKLNTTCDIETNVNWQTVTKMRYMHVDSNHMFMRVDSNEDKIERINVKNLSFNYDLIAISDYNKGFLEEDDIKYICSNHPNVFIDSKRRLGNWVNGCKFIKINEAEFNASRLVITKKLFEKIICTTGSNGCSFRNEKFPVEKIAIGDVSGAGDSFFAGLIYEYLQSGDIKLSIKFANNCATKVVQSKGVVSI